MRETSFSYTLQAPNWGVGPQPRYVPLTWELAEALTTEQNQPGHTKLFEGALFIRIKTANKMNAIAKRRLTRPRGIEGLFEAITENEPALCRVVISDQVSRKN